MVSYKDEKTTTAFYSPEAEHGGEASGAAYPRATIESCPKKSGTADYHEENDVVGSGSLLSVPMPSVPLETVRGKTLGLWSIDRRRTAKGLLAIWEKALKSICRPGFAVYVDELVKEIDKQMPVFRGVPGEDIFSGILQLVRDGVTGQNLCKLQEQRTEETITSVFAKLAKEQSLDLGVYNDVHNTMMDNGLLYNASEATKGDV